MQRAGDETSDGQQQHEPTHRQSSGSMSSSEEAEGAMAQFRDVLSHMLPDECSHVCLVASLLVDLSGISSKPLRPNNTEAVLRLFNYFRVKGKSTIRAQEFTESARKAHLRIPEALPTSDEWTFAQFLQVLSELAVGLAALSAPGTPTRCSIGTVGSPKSTASSTSYGISTAPTAPSDLALSAPDTTTTLESEGHWHIVDGKLVKQQYYRRRSRSSGASTAVSVTRSTQHQSIGQKSLEALMRKVQRLNAQQLWDMQLFLCGLEKEMSTAYTPNWATDFLKPFLTICECDQYQVWIMLIRSLLDRLRDEIKSVEQKVQIRGSQTTILQQVRQLVEVVEQTVVTSTHTEETSNAKASQHAKDLLLETLTELLGAADNDPEPATPSEMVVKLRVQCAQKDQRIAHLESTHAKQVAGLQAQMQDVLQQKQLKERENTERILDLEGRLSEKDECPQVVQQMLTTDNSEMLKRQAMYEQAVAVERKKVVQLEAALQQSQEVVQRMDVQMRQLLAGGTSDVGNHETVYKQQLAEEQQKVVSLEQRLEQSQAVAQQLDAELQQCLGGTLGRVKSEVEYQQKIVALEEQLLQQEEAAAALEERAKLLSLQLLRKDAELNEVRAKAHVESAENIADEDGVRRQVNELLEKLRRTEDNAQGLESELRVLYSEAEEKDQVIRDLQHRVAQQMQKIVEMESAQRLPQDDSQRLRHELEMKDVRIQELDTANAKLQSYQMDTAAEREKVLQLEEALEQSQASARYLDAQLKKMSEVDYQEQIGAMREQLRQQEERSSEMEEKVQVLNLQILQKNSDIEELESQARQSGEVPALKQQLDVLSDQVMHREEQLRQSEGRTRALEEQVQALSQEVASKEAEAETLQGQARALCEQSETRERQTRTSYEGVVRECAALRDEVGLKDTRIRQLESDAAMHQRIIDELQEHVNAPAKLKPDPAPESPETADCRLVDPAEQLQSLALKSTALEADYSPTSGSDWTEPLHEVVLIDHDGRHVFHALSTMKDCMLSPAGRQSGPYVGLSRFVELITNDLSSQPSTVTGRPGSALSEPSSPTFGRSPSFVHMRQAIADRDQKIAAMTGACDEAYEMVQQIEHALHLKVKRIAVLEGVVADLRHQLAQREMEFEGSFSVTRSEIFKELEDKQHRILELEAKLTSIPLDAQDLRREVRASTPYKARKRPSPVPCSNFFPL